MSKRRTIRICAGFAEFTGRCRSVAGTPWTPYWCDRCDKLRRDHITKQLENIIAELDAKQEVPF